ncbi:fatty acid hydroxylase domain-containing protein 2-like [Toxorhynchites rutilus septentrionalis]|uniref:fatty acid hydroxylase domain-containing protein 2-like n=1 Tax=Toxorhynchites rutilus septentrionalis TaxID=329112 RepID=UPI002478F2DD|nr:fatty acid hydroxylase domain-containing protein 2-like [Toxorhynchites rutilus septentrionalis]
MCGGPRKFIWRNSSKRDAPIELPVSFQTFSLLEVCFRKFATASITHRAKTQAPMSVAVEILDLPARHFQVFWGASRNLWQSLWDQFLDVTGDDPTRLWIYGTVIYTIGLYWTIGTIYTLLDVTNRPVFLRRFKIQPGTNEPVDGNRLRKVIRQVLFNQTVVGVPLIVAFYSMIGPQTTAMVRQLPAFYTVLWQLAGCLVIEEFGFYYSHRLLHAGRIYKYVHKQHHEWTAPIAITALYCHPLEHTLSNLLPIGVGVWATGCHISVAWLWFTLAISNTLHVHSGYHLPFLPSPEQHDFHHLKFNQCFGVLGVLDWLHGTNTQFIKSKQAERDYILTKFVPVREIHPDREKDE